MFLLLLTLYGAIMILGMTLWLVFILLSPLFFLIGVGWSILTMPLRLIGWAWYMMWHSPPRY